MEKTERTTATNNYARKQGLVRARLVKTSSVLQQYFCLAKNDVFTSRERIMAASTSRVQTKIASRRPHLSGDGASCLLVVAGQENDPNAHAFQGVHRQGRFGLDRVRDRQHALQMAVDRGQNGRVARFFVIWGQDKEVTFRMSPKLDFRQIQCDLIEIEIFTTRTTVLAAHANE